MVLQGRAAELWPPPSSCRVRPEGPSQSCRSERTAGVFLERRAERQAAASDPPEEESLCGQYLMRSEGFIVHVMQMTNSVE